MIASVRSSESPVLLGFEFPEQPLDRKSAPGSAGIPACLTLGVKRQAGMPALPKVTAVGWLRYDYSMWSLLYLT
jgi:hypothetical protein